MQAVFDVFNERISELDLYFSAVQELEADLQGRVADKRYLSNEFIKILKANALLMIYNLVESTVMGAILEIYERLKQEGLTYCGVRKEIQDIWFNYKFQQVYGHKAHYDSYKSKALEIVNSIMNGEVIELDRKAMPIGGNIDAKKIRSVCSGHGILFQTRQECQGGAILKTVKDKRNELAHGTLSFAECGRDYSMEDLRRFKAQTVSYLRDFLSCVQRYYNENQYRGECRKAAR